MARGMQGRFRKRPRLNTFGVAIVLSLFFHLSMVTVFQVVIFFPRQEIKYYRVDIVQASQGETPPVASGLRLEGIDLGAGRLGLSGIAPEVELPTIEFAELERLKVRTRTDDERALYESLYVQAPDDSWAQFGAGMQRLGRGIRDVALGGILGLDTEDAAPARPAFRPAEGYAGYVEWNDPESRRALLFVPPLEALWDADPAETADGLEFIIEVNPEGRITNVYSADTIRQELLDALQLKILQYRFEPITDPGARNQLGVIRILPANGGGL